MGQGWESIWCLRGPAKHLYIKDSMAFEDSLVPEPVNIIGKTNSMTTHCITRVMMHRCWGGNF